MAKLYTRRGDAGRTSLADGSTVFKSEARVEAYGAVDELNAHLGVAAATVQARGPDAPWPTLQERLQVVQNELFAIGADLATPPQAARRPIQNVAAPDQIARLEAWIDEASDATPPLKNFILPGGSDAAACLHVCRTVCRRAERRVVDLTKADPVNPQTLVYLNRLSDLLFAWARWANQLAGLPDRPWVKPSP